MSRKCGICHDNNPDGAVICRSCGTVFVEVNESVNASEGKLGPSPYSPEDGGAAPGYHGVPGGEEEVKEVSKVFSIDEALPAGCGEDVDEEMFKVVYGELIDVIIEEARDLALAVAGTSQGEAADLLGKTEKEWVHKFLNARPGELQEDGLVASPKAIGELESVFEIVYERLQKGKHEGGASIIADFLRVVYQWKGMVNRPSQVSR